MDSPPAKIQIHHHHHHQNPSQAPPPPTKVYGSRSRAFLKSLAFLQLGFAFLSLMLVVAFDIIEDESSIADFYPVGSVRHTRLVKTIGYASCLFGIITASVGLGATLGNRKDHYPMRGYFILNTLTVAFMGAFVIVLALWCTYARDIEPPKVPKYGFAKAILGIGMINAAFGLNITAGVLAAFYLIWTIVCLAVICYTWSEKVQSPRPVAQTPPHPYYQQSAPVATQSNETQVVQTYPEWAGGPTPPPPPPPPMVQGQQTYPEPAADPTAPPPPPQPPTEKGQEEYAEGSTPQVGYPPQ